MLVYKCYMLVGYALYTPFAVLGYVFAQAIFLQFFHMLYAIAPYAAYGYFCVFALGIYSFLPAPCGVPQ